MVLCVCFVLNLLAFGESVGVRKDRVGIIAADGRMVARHESRAVAQPELVESPKYLLHYFDMRARAEPIRILMQVAGTDWEDKRYSVDMTASPPKPSDELSSLYSSGKLNVSMGLMPMLEVIEPSGEVFAIGQSQTIERFIAKRHGLMGEDEYDAAQVDMVSEHLRDIGAACSSLGFCAHMMSLAGPARDRGLSGRPQGDEKKQKKMKFFKEELPAFLEKLEAALPAQTPGYAVGSKTSLADLKIHYLVEEAFSEKPEEEVQWPPKILAIAKRIADFDTVKQHQASRPVRPF